MKTETKTKLISVGDGVEGSTPDSNGFYSAIIDGVGPQKMEILKSSVALSGKTKLQYKTSKMANVTDVTALPINLDLEDGESLLVKVVGVTGQTEPTEEGGEVEDIIGDLKAKIDLKGSYEVEIPPVYDATKTVLKTIKSSTDLYKNDSLEYTVEFKYDDGKPYTLKTPPQLVNGSTVLAAGVLDSGKTKYTLKYKPASTGSLQLNIKADEVKYMSEDLKTTTTDSTPVFDSSKTVITATPNPFDVYTDEKIVITVETKLDNGQPYTPIGIHAQVSGDMDDLMEPTSTVGGTTIFEMVPPVGNYTVMVTVDEKAQTPIQIEAVTTEEPFTPINNKYSGYNPLPHRKSVYMTMGYWVIDEIIEKEAAGEPWYEDQTGYKYPNDIATIAYLLANFENVEIQESRNGRILGRDAFEFNR